MTSYCGNVSAHRPLNQSLQGSIVVTQKSLGGALTLKLENKGAEEASVGYLCI